MVQDIRNTPGFKEVSPSVIEMAPPESAPESSAPREEPFPETPAFAPLPTSPNLVSPSASAGEGGAGGEVTVDVDPVQTDSLKPQASDLKPQDLDFSAWAELGSLIGSLVGSPEKAETSEQAESDIQAVSLTQVERESLPELSGYESLIAKELTPSDLRGSQDSTTPASLGFVEPLTNPALDPVVREKLSSRKSVPVTIRNNNMGAISIVGKIDGSFASRQKGFVGTTKRPAREGGYYAKFATPEDGVAAASNLLKSYGSKGVNTPTAITRKWAAEPGNYPNVLVKYLKEAGISASVDSAVDLDNPTVRMAILKAKSAHESGMGRPVYNEAVFRKGVFG